MNFSLDPSYRSRLAGVVDNVAPSPYAELLQQDYDGTTNGMIDMLTRLASRSNAVNPAEAVPTPNATTADSDPESSTLSRGADIFGTILKAPFRLLGAGVEGLQDALGAPASVNREARQQYLDNVDRLGLATSALTAEQKAALGYTPGMFDTQPRKPGIWEVISGNAQKEEARKAARVAAVKRALEMNFGQAKTLNENMQAFQHGAEGRKSYLEGNEVEANNIEWRAVRAAERIKELAGAAAESARAGKERAQAGLYGAQTSGEWQNQRLSEDSYWQTRDQRDRAFEQTYDQSKRAFDLDQQQRRQGFTNKESLDAQELDLKRRGTDAWVRAQDPTAKGATYEDVAKADNDRRDLFQRTYTAALKNTKDEQVALKLAAAVTAVDLKKLPDGWFGSTVGGTTVPVFDAPPSAASFTSTRPSEQRSTFTPSGDDGQIHDTYLKLKKDMPELEEGQLMGLARDLKPGSPVTLDEWNSAIPTLPSASAARDWIVETYKLSPDTATAIARRIASRRAGR